MADQDQTDPGSDQPEQGQQDPPSAEGGSPGATHPDRGASAERSRESPPPLSEPEAPSPGPDESAQWSQERTEGKTSPQSAAWSRGPEEPEKPERPEDEAKARLPREEELEEWAKPRDERWQVLETLGRGGMGIVFKCRDQRLKRLVAIKRVLSLDRRAVERFRHEAEAIAGLPHTNILQIHDFLDDGAGPYIVMEYAPGGDLEQEVKLNGALTVERCIEMVGAVAEGLLLAHGRTSPETGDPEPIYHRDIKPSNILLMADGTPRLSDFGLARLEAGTELTVTGAGLGTPVYMAPEQAEGAHDIGPEADIYALGKTLYFLSTGETPTTIILDRLPVKLRSVVRKCIELQPENRYRTVAELLDALVGKTDTSVTLLEGECPNCGFRNPLDARTCGRCRESLLRACPNTDCGRDVQLWARYCAYCDVEIAVEREVQELLAGAQELLDQHFPRRAEAKVKEVLEANPEHRAARELAKSVEAVFEEARELKRQAQALLGGDDIEKAQPLLEEGLSADQENRWFPERLDELPERIRRRDLRLALASGSEMLDANRPQGAQPFFEEALRLESSDPQAGRGVEECSARMARVQELATALDESEESGRTDEAERICHEILALDADRSDIERRQGDLSKRLSLARGAISSARESSRGKQWANSIKHWQCALEHWPACEEAKQELAGAQESLSQFERSIARARELESGGRTSAALAEARQALEAGTSPAARELADQLTEKMENAQSLARSGLEAASQRQWRDAAESLAEAREIDADAVDEDDLSGSLEKAEQFERSVARAQALESERRASAALAEAKQALEIGTSAQAAELADHLEERVERAQSLAKSGLEAAGQRLWRGSAAHLLAASRIDVEAVDRGSLSEIESKASCVLDSLNRARELLSEGRFAEALAETKRTQELGTRDPELLRLTEEARGLSEKARHIENTASINERTDPVEARNLWKRVLEAQPYRRDVEKRIRELDSVISRADKELRRAERLLGLRKWGGALRAAQEAMALNPQLREEAGVLCRRVHEQKRPVLLRVLGCASLLLISGLLLGVAGHLMDSGRPAAGAIGLLMILVLGPASLVALLRLLGKT